MSYLNVNQISTAAGAPSFTTAAGGININGNVLGAGNSSTMKNRIINGAMVIDQRNAGAAVTVDGYNLDRWQLSASPSNKFTVQQNAGSVTPPAGFTNYLGLTTASAVSIGSTDYFILTQFIEGYNIADLNFGSATNAKTVTVSFWVRSSLTGTFGGGLSNSASNRSYPFSYSIPVANTWTQISVTVTGDTTGTWLTTNGTGLKVFFGLGVGSTYSGTAGSWAGSWYPSATGAVSVVGTAGATFYITGVQLEVGSSATGYEYRQYTTELQLAQRYYFKADIGGSNLYATAYTGSTSFATISLPVTMRSTPTFTATSVPAYTSLYGNTNEVQIYIPQQYSAYATALTASAEL
jgi:hypothetical protein